MDVPFYARLAGNAGLAALCGDRIYPEAAPAETASPFIVWQRISGVPEPGALDAENDITTARVQVDSYATTALAARTLANAVRAALRDWKASDGVIRNVEFSNDRAIREDDPALKMSRVAQEYEVTFVE